MASTSVQAPTLQQQLNQAVKEAAEKLGLADLKSLTLALVEAVTSTLDTDESLAQNIRTRYESITSGSNKKSENRTRSIASSSDKKLMDLVPIKRIVDREFDISAPLDPYFLLELYGVQQLQLALSRYTVKQLQEAVAMVEHKSLSTKPKGKATKELLIGYIVNQLSQS